MAFKDKLAAACGMAPAADYATEIGGQLTAGDTLIAHAQAIPSAFKGGGSAAISITQRLTAMAVHTAANAVSKQRHMDGEPGTLAHTLPRDGSLSVLAFTRSGLSLWNFGPFGADSPGQLILSIERERIAAVEDTGQRAQGGVPVARVAFTDGSFFDYRLMSKPGQDFWAALRTW